MRRSAVVADTHSIWVTRPSPASSRAELSPTGYCNSSTQSVSIVVWQVRILRSSRSTSLKPSTRPIS